MIYKQNKMELLSLKSQENRYRSFKYRSVSTQITTKSIISAKLRQDSLSISKNQNMKFTSRSTKDLTLSLPNCLNSKKQKASYTSAKNSQFFKDNRSNINNQEEEDPFRKSKYLQNFESLMALQSSKKIDYSKLGAVANKLVQIKSKFKGSRFNLPNLIQYQNSKFTTLDPIRLPIQYIQNEISEAKVVLKNSSKQIQQMKGQLENVRQKVEKSLEQINNYSKKVLTQFSRLLKQNNVQQQQTTLKVNRHLVQLKQFVGDFKQKFEYTINSQLKIQEDIFQNRPFELKMIGEQQSQLKGSGRESFFKSQQKQLGTLYF